MRTEAGTESAEERGDGRRDVGRVAHGRGAVDYDGEVWEASMNSADQVVEWEDEIDGNRTIQRLSGKFKKVRVWDGESCSNNDHSSRITLERPCACEKHEDPGCTGTIVEPRLEHSSTQMRASMQGKHAGQEKMGKAGMDGSGVMVKTMRYRAERRRRRDGGEVL